MALTLDASELPVADRADAVREAIAATIVHVDIEFPDRPDRQVAARGAIGDLGPLTVCSIRSSAVAAEQHIKRQRGLVPAVPGARGADRIPHGVRAAIPPSVRRGLRKVAGRDRPQGAQ